MQGFYFALRQCSPIQAFTVSFAPSMQNYTAHATKQRTGLYSGFSCDYARSTAHDTRPTQAAIIPPAPRWSVSQRRNTSSTYQIPTSHRTLYGSAQPPYYNKVYEGAPCYGSMPARRGLDTSHARRLVIWHWSAVRAYRVSPAHFIRRGSPAAGTRRAARNH